MNFNYTKKLDSAINALCPEIWDGMNTLSRSNHSEQKLWEELVGCILGSQVTFESSQLFLKKLKQSHLLERKAIGPSYENRLGKVLKSPVIVNGRPIKYRFPNSKAKQIATAQEKLYGNGIRLKELLTDYSESSKLRSTLVELIPGIGMKQASMYLRNVSNTFELAVIDSHILKYMTLMDLVKKIPSTISRTQYLKKENILIKYTEKFGYPVGCVDYAIWIVMRVAKKDGYL